MHIRTILVFVIAIFSAGQASAQSAAERYAVELAEIKQKAVAAGLSDVLVAYAVESERQRLLRIEELRAELEQLRETRTEDKPGDRRTRMRDIDRELTLVGRNRPHYRPRFFKANDIKPDTLGRIEELDGRVMEFRVIRIIEEDVVVELRRTAKGTDRTSRQAGLSLFRIAGFGKRHRVGDVIDPKDMVFLIGGMGQYEVDGGRTLRYRLAEIINVDADQKVLDEVLRPSR